MTRVASILAAVAACVLLVYVFFGYRPLAYVLMGTALASVSYVVYYRRLEFLAAGSTHAALFATSLAVLVEHYTGVTYYYASIPLGLLVVYIAGLLIKSGMDPGKASAVVVSSSSALAVVSAHYALRTVPGRISLSALVLGDPLLLTRDEVVLGALASIVIVLAVAMMRSDVVESSIDAVSARLAGIHVNLLEISIYTVIGFSAVALLRFAGYVMEHVFLLLPAIASSGLSRTTSEHFLFTILVGAMSASIGYTFAVFLKLAPTGVTGIAIIVLWVLSRGMGWKK